MTNFVLVVVLIVTAKNLQLISSNVDIKHNTLAQITRMLKTAMTIEHPMSMARNLDNFRFRYVLWKYP